MKCRHLLFFLPVLLTGCVPSGRSDGGFVGATLRGAARALRAGHAYDAALLADGRGDQAGFARNLEIVRGVGVSGALRPAVKLANSAAAEQLDVAMELSQNAEAQHGAARKLLQDGADQAYRRAQKLNPEFPGDEFIRLNALGYFLADRGSSSEDFKAAEIYTRRALQGWDKRIADLKDDDAKLPLFRFVRALTAHDSLGWALFKAGRFEEARREQSAAVAQARAELKAVPVEEQRGMADMLFHLGVIETACGDTVAARAALDEALAINAEHEEARAAREKLADSGSKRTVP